MGWRSSWRSLGEADRGVITGFGTAALAKVQCPELGLRILRVVFSALARAEAVSALCDSMVFVVALRARRGGFSHQGY